MNWRTPWERVYTTPPIDRGEWPTPHLKQSPAFSPQIGLPHAAHVLDVSGGASTLVDDLLRLDSITMSMSVLDFSARAQELARERLGSQARLVTWIEGKITIMATFAPEVPPTSGSLPLQRDTVNQPQDTLSPEFELLEHTDEPHITPGGVEQLDLYASFRRREPRA